LHGWSKVDDEHISSPRHGRNLTNTLG